MFFIDHFSTGNPLSFIGTSVSNVTLDSLLVKIASLPDLAKTATTNQPFGGQGLQHLTDRGLRDIRRFSDLRYRGRISKAVGEILKSFDHTGDDLQEHRQRRTPVGPTNKERMLLSPEKLQALDKLIGTLKSIPDFPRGALRDRVLRSLGKPGGGTAEELTSTISGSCLYLSHQPEDSTEEPEAAQSSIWEAYTIRPSESASIAQAEAWLVKRKWQPW